APGRRHARETGGGRVATAAAGGLCAADVSAGRPCGSRLLRSTHRSRRYTPEGMALPDAVDVLRPRLRVDLRATGPGQLSRWPRPRVCPLRGHARARGV